MSLSNKEIGAPGRTRFLINSHSDWVQSDASRAVVIPRAARPVLGSISFQHRIIGVWQVISSKPFRNHETKLNRSQYGPGGPWDDDDDRFLNRMPLQSGVPDLQSPIGKSGTPIDANEMSYRGWLRSLKASGHGSHGGAAPLPRHGRTLVGRACAYMEELGFVKVEGHAGLHKTALILQTAFLA